jgi:hypothetical protein
MKNSKRFPQSLTVVCLGLALAISLISLVPNASAASQNWYLYNEMHSADTGYTNIESQEKMVKGTADTAGTVIIAKDQSNIWVADEKAQTSVSLAGAWTGSIKITGTLPTGVLTIEIGYYDTQFRSFSPRASGTVTFTASTTGIIAITASACTVPNTKYLAMKLTDPKGGFNGATVTTDSGSYISSPATDPGYPVSELSTLALMTSGLVAGTAMLIYSNKKRR